MWPVTKPLLVSKRMTLCRRSAPSPSALLSKDSKKTLPPPGCLDHLDFKKPRKWKIIVKEPFGRCIVAKQDIREGEVLFLDHPVVTGPKQLCNVLCLGCYKQLDESEYKPCSRCRWPVCNTECETKGYHHLECAIYSKTGYAPRREDFGGESSPMYESLLPLRCYLMKEHHPQKWKTLMSLESHNDLRRGNELWNIEQTNVCDFLHKCAKIDADDELLHTITGILDVNCHEVRSNIPGTQDEYRVRGVYPLTAMMSHDCSSNTHHTVMHDMTMLVVASRDIKKGHQVTGTYTHLLSGTIERRKHLRYGKFFDCACERCSDPTEFGTYFSAIRCPTRNCGGNVISKNPLDPRDKADFGCDKCDYSVSVGTVNRMNNLIQHELNASSETNPLELEMVFRKYQNLLHPNHFQLIGIKHSLSQVYGRVENFMLDEMSETQVQRKIECCRDLLFILDKLDPGISRLRGLTYYELHAPLLQRANRAFQDTAITKNDLLEKLNECRRYLEHTIYCLKFEPPSSFEGEICKISRGSLEELKKWIKVAENLPQSNFLEDHTLDAEPSKLTYEDLTLEELLKNLDDE